MNLFGEIVQTMPPKVPVWLVMSDDQFCSNLKNEIEKRGSLKLENFFTNWCSALATSKNLAGAPYQVTVVKADLPHPKDFNWISILSGISLAVIAILENLNNDELLTAIQCGVSGLLTASSSITQIISTIYTVAHGGIVMSPEILKRILLPFSESSSETRLLTSRESDVACLLVKGYTLMEIADRLSISYLTAKTHNKNIHKKLGVKNRAGLVSSILNNGVL